MRKLALNDEILLNIEKPARYIGGELNAVMKEAESVDKREDVWCERVYSPWLDLDKILREHDIPLFALESQSPVKNFDFLGITLQFEMCYTNILQILDLSKIPLHADNRTESDSIVIG